MVGFQVCQDNNMKEVMKSHLNGIYWDVGARSFDIPYIRDSQKAVYVYQQNRVPITWHLMRLLENTPATFSQTATILNGYTVGGLEQHDMMQVVNYGKAGQALLHLIRTEAFELTEAFASKLHHVVAKDDALVFGRFRTGDVSLQGCQKPLPQASQLSEIAAKGFKFLETEIKDPKERAIGVFLFMARNQFFFNANRRTATLMMNGCLMREGYFPITIFHRDGATFYEKFSEFYETGDANALMAFFEHQVSTLYPPKDKLPAFVR